MTFWNEDRTVAFCDNREGADGCGNVDNYVIPKEERPEGFTGQYCSHCGKKVKIVRWQEGVEITCPNNHVLIDRNHKHCIVCGESLKIRKISSITEVTE